MGSYRPRAVLKIDRRNTADVLRRARAMDNGMGDNAAQFTAPSPPLSVLEAQIAKVEQCQAQVEAGGRGMASARDFERSTLVGMMESERQYVQLLADSTPTWEAKVALIQASGLEVAGDTSYQKAVLTVRQGPPGTVELDAYARLLAGKRGPMRFFNWEYTTNGGQSFVALPPTPISKTTVANLTPLTTVGFRVCVTHSDGTTGAWSQVVMFLVQ